MKVKTIDICIIGEKCHLVVLHNSSAEIKVKIVDTFINFPKIIQIILFYLYFCCTGDIIKFAVLEPVLKGV